VIEGAALLGLTYEARGKQADARAQVERALRLAAPDGYIQTFVCMGAPMLALLSTLSVRDDLRPYLHQLLNAFAAVQPNPARTPGPPRVITTPTRVDPLTARELEVLRLIAAGKSNGEIATSMVVAVSTVKAHINSIFGKLDVTSRTQALVRARDLQLL
jgi:LuxR family maltose regulon positive regulatory protein